MTEASAQFWDQQAATFDAEVDHGLLGRAGPAWSSLLLSHLPPVPATVVDLGCGTGSLSVLLAQAGYTVHGLDISPEMLRLAAVKARKAGVAVNFQIGDAAAPDLTAGSFDVVMARHLLWVFDDPAAVLARWVALMRPGGTLALVEGYWTTGVGIPADRCRELLADISFEVVRLSDDENLWGGPVLDERYLVVGRP